MKVSNWMTRKVFTTGPRDSISHAMRLMRERKIKHLPVIAGKKLRAIVSDRDIKAYSPTGATSLDVYELHYLLARALVRDIMRKPVITTRPDAPIEEASLVMLENDVGCLPVVEGNDLIGIISDKDIFRALVDITGIRHGGHRLAVKVEDRAGSIREVADIIRKHGFGLQSILTSYEGARKGYRRIVVRTTGSGRFRALKNELEGTYTGVEIRKG